MFAFVTIAKRTGAHTFNGIGKIRITAQSIAKLPGSGASVKLSTTPVLCRSLSGTCQRSTYVDENDPDSRYAINTERSEYSKSGTDNAVAAQSSAWDIKNQTPESAREESEKEWAREGRSKASPLEVSPANQEVSRFTDESGRGASVIHGPSKRVSPKKGKKVELAAPEAGSDHETTKV
ncbi:uncharacterized protein CIMG_01333 [Coccidioides immitis RS]|uniref:Uncharacterized protein n=1 Tax=Coccidioides immitis (strain RS) TaxID=246410 RepID=J3KIZ5_COCIM|nr:uncharacterized protein CIMG_01333 [Coccidioides immitis RS]EAS35979.3 hypothetical protein CIMG_01333 [Coccidioides immitis RS]TPX25838.1 hypothetical protein DIZ76_011295 [Coccidioides immitis]